MFSDPFRQFGVTGANGNLGLDNDTLNIIMEVTGNTESLPRDVHHSSAWG